MIRDTFKTIIVDDERPARLRLTELINTLGKQIEIVAEASNGSEAIALINLHQPDLIFLDIQMPDMNGFEVLAQINHQPMVIITSAYDQYAIKAFEENTIDYLLKPIEETRFLKCLQKINSLDDGSLKADYSKLKLLFDELKPKKVLTALPIKNKDKIFLIRLNDIAYIESDLGYTVLHTTQGKKHLSELTLAELEQKLPLNFLRVQKSYIVNTDKVLEISKYFNNRLVLTLDDAMQSRITSGTSYISKIREHLNL